MYQHSLRVSQLVESFAKSIGLNDDYIKKLKKTDDINYIENELKTNMGTQFDAYYTTEFLAFLANNKLLAKAK